MKLSKILKEIKKQITPATWVKDTWQECNLTGGPCSACLAGQVEVYYGVKKNYDYNYSFDVTSVPKLYIRNAIVKYTRGYFAGIVDFNDDRDTTFKDIQKVMDIAIKQADKDNVDWVSPDDVAEFPE